MIEPKRHQKKHANILRKTRTLRHADSRWQIPYLVRNFTVGNNGGFRHKKNDRLSPIASYLRCDSQKTKSRYSKPRPSKTNSYASYFLMTSVAFVPPKPKLLDITVLSSTSRFSVTISRPLAASSRFSMLILGATKPCSSINVE